MFRSVEREDVQRSDAQAILITIRFYLHAWPILVGLLTLIPRQFPSTERDLLTSFGLPPLFLGITLLVSGVLLVMSQITVLPWQRWVLAVGDFIVGSECLVMAVVMGGAALHRQAGFLSMGLWLLPAVMFLMLCVQRIRNG